MSDQRAFTRQELSEELGYTIGELLRDIERTRSERQMNEHIRRIRIDARERQVARLEAIREIVRAQPELRDD